MEVISYAILVILSALYLISCAYALYLWPQCLVASAVDPDSE